jgi:hypothetical protein
MAEEYSMQNGELLVRKWRRKNTLGAVLPWDFEVGHDISMKVNVAEDLIESSSNVNLKFLEKKFFILKYLSSFCM